MRSYSHCRSASATVFDFDDPVTRHLDLGPEVLQLAALTQRLNLGHCQEVLGSADGEDILIIFKGIRVWLKRKGSSCLEHLARESVIQLQRQLQNDERRDVHR